jgi:hypothetical protein
MSETADAPLVFATTIYGRRHLRFLAPHVYSVARAHPEAAILVLGQGLPDIERLLLTQAFGQLEFRPVEAPIGGTADQRISRKMRLWKAIAESQPGKTICFLDCDTLVVRPIRRFLDEPYDVAFTWKDEVFPLNTGVLVARTNPRTERFFEEWAARTERIVSNREQLALALQRSGGGDQQAFREIVGFLNYDGTRTCRVAGQDLTVRGFPCEMLNETRSVPITEKTHIIHYKGGWHPVLLEGEPFTAQRSEGDSAEMYRFWLSTEREASAFIARQVVGRACALSMRNAECGMRNERHTSAPGGSSVHSALRTPHSALSTGVVAAVCGALGAEAVVEVADRAAALAPAPAGGEAGPLPPQLPHGGTVPADQLDRHLSRLGPRRVGLVVSGRPDAEAAAEIARAMQQGERIAAAFFRDGLPPMDVREREPDPFQRAFQVRDAASLAELCGGASRPAGAGPSAVGLAAPQEGPAGPLTVVFPRPPLVRTGRSLASRLRRLVAAALPMSWKRALLALRQGG